MWCRIVSVSGSSSSCVKVEVLTFGMMGGALTISLFPPPRWASFGLEFLKLLLFCPVVSPEFGGWMIFITDGSDLVFELIRELNPKLVAYFPIGGEQIGNS